MSCSREELRALLRPWTQALCDWDDLLLNTSQRCGVVWIHMGLDHRRNFIPAVYEAVELLTLVGELDIAAWREAVQLVWERSPLEQTQSDKALQFGLDLISGSTDRITVASYCNRVLSTGVPSAEYSAARTKLETMYKEKERAGEAMTPRGELQVAVRVGRHHFLRDVAEVCMRELYQIVERQASNQERSSSTTQA